MTSTAKKAMVVVVGLMVLAVALMLVATATDKGHWEHDATGSRYYDENGTLRYSEYQELELASRIFKEYFSDHGDLIRKEVFDPATGKIEVYNSAGKKISGSDTDGNSSQIGSHTVGKEGESTTTISEAQITGTDAAGNQTYNLNSNSGKLTLKVSGGQLVIDGDSLMMEGPESMFLINPDEIMGMKSAGMGAFKPQFGLDHTTGDAFFRGDLNVDGTKNAVVETANYGVRTTYADESTDVRFFDRGQCQLTDGQATVNLDPVFLELVTINEENPMLVQVTLTSDCNGVFIAEKTGSSFTVKELQGGDSSATFDWEVAAKRKDCEDMRLEIYHQGT